MYTLIIDCGNFALEHSAYVIDSNDHLQCAANLSFDKIAEYANAAKVDTIKLRGNPEFCKGIKEQIENDLALEYADKNIKVEVI